MMRQLRYVLVRVPRVWCVVSAITFRPIDTLCWRDLMPIFRPISHIALFPIYFFVFLVPYQVRVFSLIDSQFTDSFCFFFLYLFVYLRYFFFRKNVRSWWALACILARRHHRGWWKVWWTSLPATRWLQKNCYTNSYSKWYRCWIRTALSWAIRAARWRAKTWIDNIAL